VHTGVAQASSNMEVSGPVMVRASTNDQLAEIYFYLQLAAGGNPVDMEKVTYTVSTITKTVTYQDDNEKITRVKVGSADDGDNLLEPLEMMQITVGLGDFTEADKIDVNKKFLIEVKPDKGASLPISKTAPSSMKRNAYYEVN